MALVLYGLGGEHTHTHTHIYIPYEETRRAPGLTIVTIAVCSMDCTKVTFCDCNCICATKQHAFLNNTCFAAYCMYSTYICSSFCFKKLMPS